MNATQLNALRSDGVGDGAERAAALPSARRTPRSAVLGSLIALAAIALSLALAIATSAVIFGSDGGLV